ncbi:DUF4357 domain-containing protein [Candidatus Mycosynbacter amalyticus]|uniref:DUF4357 domain-containing protein n=1 Tax=Candidatus Mycosynbacter amalyticus TaxID=2665156 RepID=A0A857MPX2_9BACT|nr:GIY-YIG nuclease family protein [Candidatus Mycosynbacter amalyticus]QHN43299.1 DUF4357 domain-containing protein [Candidatus Mycosynbacter amalyticus]
MNNPQPRLIQTYLPDGTLEGIRVIELSDSSIKAFVIPRLQLKNAKVREELLRPSIYFLVSSSDSLGYIGESENFFHRVKNHDQNKQFWDVAIAIVSTTNSLEKSDVKYLESLAVERAQSGSMTIENKTVPIRNNVHEFKLHILQKILDDTQLILTSLGYDILSSPDIKEDVWYCKSKKTEARAQFRGDKFVVLQGSIIDKSHSPSWATKWSKSLAEREEIFEKYGRDLGDTVELTENVAFKSPNHAGGFATGHNINAWVTWKDESGQTMDEVMRKG